MAGAPQQGQSDGSSGILWVVAAIFALMMAVWYKGQVYIVEYYFKLKLWEIDVISYVTNNLDDVRTTILLSDPAHTSFDVMLKVGSAVGYYLRIPCIILIFCLSILIYSTNKIRQFKRIYSMRDLVNLEKGNWAQANPIAALELVKTDIDKGPWAMAMTPMQFCKKFGLLEEFKRAPQEGVSRKEWSKIEVNLRRGRANRLFAMQLGPLWQGGDRLPPHVKALFAIFAGRANSDPVAIALIRQLNLTATTKLDFKGVDELYKKYSENKLVKEVVASHAYVLTVMASMLQLARSDGVQATADFLWLKPMDRRLWYTLNTVGRQTPFTEVAGVFAHWVAEREMGRKLLIPMVEEATNALDLALKEIIYKPDEE
jgi:intracellular multiplication protein IcmP